MLFFSISACLRTEVYRIFCSYSIRFEQQAKKSTRIRSNGAVIRIRIVKAVPSIAENCSTPQPLNCWSWSVAATLSAMEFIAEDKVIIAADLDGTTVRTVAM